MKIIDVIPTTKIPLAQPQILSYFSAADVLAGSLVEVPLARRKETGVVVDCREVLDFKQEIKRADFEMRRVLKIVSSEPVLTEKQVALALWAAKYYWASPGIFLKMMISKKNPKSQFSISNKITNPKPQTLILYPTVPALLAAKGKYPNAIIWHSGLTQKQAREAREKIKNGETETILGARSALFLPFLNLKEIAIEDGANSGHRSWDMFPHYRSQEIADKLAELFGAKLEIKSDIPSIETNFLVNSINLPADKQRAQTALIDMREEIKRKNFSIFSETLQREIAKTLAAKKQIILFINRRGAANFVLCRDCGFVANCPNCEVPLAHHLINGQPALICHHCGHKETPPGLCPKCQSHRIKTVGTGTQKVELEAQKLFPAAKIARLDGDIAPDAKTQQKVIEAFAEKKIEILVSTQITFSWLDNLPSVELAALISADTLLHLPDFRSGERTFQTIWSLGHIAQKLAIQSYNPENSVLKYAAKNNWKDFYQEEIDTRKILGYPPFSQLIKLTFRHHDPQKAGTEAKILAVKLKRAGKEKIADISEALPAFIPKEKGKYVWNIIMKIPISKSRFQISDEFLQKRNSILKYVPSNWEIDVDPESLL